MARPVVYKDKDINMLIDKMYEYIENEEYPTLENFFKYANIQSSSFYFLEKKHKKLMETKKIIFEKTKNALLQDGVRNKINPTMAIFWLKNLGMTDKQQVEHTVDTSAKESLKEVLLNPVADRTREDIK